MISGSRVKYEEDVWIVRGIKTKQIFRRFRLKRTAHQELHKIENIFLEECEIVFDYPEKKK